jgi:hypothetical protein
MRTKTCIVHSTPCEADKQTVGDGVRPQVPQHVRSAPIHLDVKRPLLPCAAAWIRDMRQ